MGWAVPAAAAKAADRPRRLAGAWRGPHPAPRRPSRLLMRRIDGRRGLARPGPARRCCPPSGPLPLRRGAPRGAAGRSFPAEGRRRARRTGARAACAAAPCTGRNAPMRPKGGLGEAVRPGGAHSGLWPHPCLGRCLLAQGAAEAGADLNVHPGRAGIIRCF